MNDIREVLSEDQRQFDVLALHPMQSWSWGTFREKTGIEVVRLGRYEGKRLVETAQITIHPLPLVRRAIGYVPKGAIPSKEMIAALVSLGKQKRCVFIKLEPNVEKINQPTNQRVNQLTNSSPPTTYHLQPSSHPLFTRYTFHLDLTPAEDQLLKGLHHKTRYNIRVAQKHGVVIEESTSEEALEDYLRLTFETTKRQQFYAHTEKYHRLMWETLHPSGMAHLLRARYQHEGSPTTLAAWVLFLCNDVLYYPYGASSDLYRNVMASNLMMWEAIRFGKARGAKLFDMWGAMGPDPDPTDPWYGFHRFKQGYGAHLVELVGSYDLVIDPVKYRLYNTAHTARQLLLRLRSRMR